MHNFTPLRSLLGGMLLGLAASVLAIGAGRVAGISGIVGGLFTPGHEGRGWRLQFLA
ncbi:MAG TPA: YeeE/YedE family protein, partial [Polyangia bacterium]|nr:YeeE/YedE family protein [Polyangia bacterium]